MTKSYAFHAGALKTQNLAFVLCCITILMLPIGLWVRHRAKTAKLTIDDDGVVARGRYSTTTVKFADVARFGTFRFRQGGGAIAQGAAAGLGGGSNVLTNLCFQNRAGKTTSFLVSTFENEPEILASLAQALKMRPESVAYWHKWPARPAVAAAA